MSFFVRQCQALLLSAVLIWLVCWMGCGTADNGVQQPEFIMTWCGSWEITTPATCNATGVEKRTCSGEGVSRTETRVIERKTGSACNSTGDGSFDGRIVCADGEAWIEGGLYAWIFKADGNLTMLQKSGDGWRFLRYGTWSTNGSTLTVSAASTLVLQYTVSDDSLIVTGQVMGVRINETWTKMYGVSY